MPSIARIMNESQHIKYSYPALKTLNENLKLKDHLKESLKNNETQFNLNDKFMVDFKYERRLKKYLKLKS